MVPGPVKKDTNNWAPRVGFAWSPRSDSALLGDGKTVIRGGWGMGYDVLFYNLLVVDASNFPRVVTANVLTTSRTSTRTSSPPAAPPSSTRWPPGPTRTRTRRIPSAQFYSLSVQRELGDFVVELGYTGSRGYHGINQIDVNPARVVTPEQAALVRQTRQRQRHPRRPGAAPEPAVRDARPHPRRRGTGRHRHRGALDLQRRLHLA